MFLGGGWGDSLTVELARSDLERETIERYKGFVVRSWLKRVLNEAVKSNATAHEEEVRRFPDRYIDAVKSADGCMLRLTPQMGACCDRLARYVMPFVRIYVIALPAVLISRLRSFAVILPTSPAPGLLKWLVARVWLLNAKPVMHWSRSASTSR